MILLSRTSYEEGVGLNEVYSSELRKKRIDTRSLVSEVDRAERKEIFGNGLSLIVFFNMCDCLLQIT